MALVDYLANRKAEIEAQMKALKAELIEIRIAEDALAGAAGGRRVVSAAGGSFATSTAVGVGSAVVREGTIKDWVLRVLQIHDGLETESVINAIVVMGGPDIPRNSMTPQLSRLKADGLIEQEGRHWRLLRRLAAPEDETPGVQPPGASVAEGEGDIVDRLFGLRDNP